MRPLLRFFIFLFIAAIDAGFAFSAEPVEMVLLGEKLPFYTSYNEESSAYINKKTLAAGRIEVSKVFDVGVSEPSRLQAMAVFEQAHQMFRDPKAGRAVQMIGFKAMLHHVHTWIEDDNDISAWTSWKKFSLEDKQVVKAAISEGLDLIPRPEIAAQIFINSEILHHVFSKSEIEVAIERAQKVSLDVVTGKLVRANRDWEFINTLLDNCWVEQKLDMVLDGDYLIDLKDQRGLSSLMAEVLTEVPSPTSSKNRLSKEMLDGLARQKATSKTDHGNKRALSAFQIHRILILHGDERGFEGFDRFRFNWGGDRLYVSLLAKNLRHPAARKALEEIAAGKIFKDSGFETGGQASRADRRYEESKKRAQDILDRK